VRHQRVPAYVTSVNSSSGAPLPSRSNSRAVSGKKQEAATPAKVLGKRTGDELEAPKTRQPQRGGDTAMNVVISTLKGLAFEPTEQCSGKGRYEATKAAPQPKTPQRSPNTRQHHNAMLPFYRYDVQAQNLSEEMREFSFPYSKRVIVFQPIEKVWLTS